MFLMDFVCHNAYHSKEIENVCMNCFNHPDKVAIGICKACGKGLCSECVTDLGYGLACKDKHEKAVESVSTMIAREMKIQESAPKDVLITPIFFFFMGFAFVSVSYYSGYGFMDIGFIAGAGIMVFSVITFLRNRAIFNNKE